MSNLIEKAAEVWDKAGLVPIWKEESTGERTSVLATGDTSATQTEPTPASEEVPVTDVSDVHDEKPPVSIPAEPHDTSQPLLKFIHDDGPPEDDPRDYEHTLGTLTDKLMERARRGF